MMDNQWCDKDGKPIDLDKMSPCEVVKEIEKLHARLFSRPYHPLNRTTEPKKSDRLVTYFLVGGCGEGKPDAVKIGISKCIERRVEARKSSFVREVITLAGCIDGDVELLFHKAFDFSRIGGGIRKQTEWFVTHGSGDYWPWAAVLQKFLFYAFTFGDGAWKDNYSVISQEAAADALSAAVYLIYSHVDDCIVSAQKLQTELRMSPTVIPRLSGYATE
jgi:hypothetical protein